MRIIAGDLRGRVIASPSERTTRPTTDRVRESMFSSIYSRLPELRGVTVLDAFAGSGALGIEALSRGAHCCLFAERDRGARRVLEQNLSSLGLLPPRAKVVPADVFGIFSGSTALPADAFGLVLLDPPYALEVPRVHDLLDTLASHAALESGCVVVYEHALESSQAVADEFAHDERFGLTGQKKYGKIGVTYLKFDGREE